MGQHRRRGVGAGGATVNKGPPLPCQELSQATAPEVCPENYQFIKGTRGNNEGTDGFSISAKFKQAYLLIKTTVY